MAGNVSVFLRYVLYRCQVIWHPPTLFRGRYKDKLFPPWMIALVDRISGRPLSVSGWYREPKQIGFLNRGDVWSAIGIGGGNQYLVNHYIASELRYGGEAIILEWYSYDKLTEFFWGKLFWQHEMKAPLYV